MITVGARVKITHPRKFVSIWEIFWFPKKLVQEGTLASLNEFGRVELRMRDGSLHSWTLIPGTTLEFL